MGLAESEDYFAEDDSIGFDSIDVRSNGMDSVEVADPESLEEMPAEVEQMDMEDTVPTKRSWAYMFSCCLGNRRSP